jgi:hypothetical protein
VSCDTPWIGSVADRPDGSRALARALATLSVHVSVDIEDSTAELLIPAAHAAKVAAIKERVPGLFVNARVDTYWLGQDADVGTTLGRAVSLRRGRRGRDLRPRRVRPGRGIRAAVAVADAVRHDGVLPEGAPYAELQARLTSYAHRNG